MFLPLSSQGSEMPRGYRTSPRSSPSCACMSAHSGLTKYGPQCEHELKYLLRVQVVPCQASFPGNRYEKVTGAASAASGRVHRWSRSELSFTKSVIRSPEITPKSRGTPCLRVLKRAVKIETL